MDNVVFPSITRTDRGSELSPLLDNRWETKATPDSVVRRSAKGGVDRVLHRNAAGWWSNYGHPAVFGGADVEDREGTVAPYWCEYVSVD